MSKIEPTEAHLKEACDLLNAEYEGGGQWLPHEIDRNKGLQALAKYIANQQPDCPSCHGLNSSCPDGCGRDSETGELNGSTLGQQTVPLELVALLRRARPYLEAERLMEEAKGIRGQVAYRPVRQICKSIDAILCAADPLDPIDPLVEEFWHGCGEFAVADSDEARLAINAFARFTKRTEDTQ